MGRGFRIRQSARAIALSMLAGTALISAALPSRADSVSVRGGSITIRIGSDSDYRDRYDDDYYYVRDRDGRYYAEDGYYYSDGYYYDRYGRRVYRDRDIEDSTLVNPVIIDSDIEDSTLVNPVIIDSRDRGSNQVIIIPGGRSRTVYGGTRSRSTYRSGCTLFADMRAACQ